MQGFNFQMFMVVYDHTDYPALPKEKVLAMKKKIMSLHPQYISSPIEFKPVWTNCVGAIYQSLCCWIAKHPPALIDITNA